MSVLVLGSAQWGSDYGITNEFSRPSDQELTEIIQMAIQSGVTRIDTAPRYGDAQSRLRPWTSHLEITTKVSGQHHESVLEQVRVTLGELGAQSIQSVLVHDWEELDEDLQRDTAMQLLAARELGIVQRIGASVYEEIGVAKAAEAFKVLDVLQVPANVLDRRFDETNLQKYLDSHSTKIQVRSVFLQGLLVNRSDTLLGSHSAVQDFHKEYGTLVLARALAHVRALPWADEILVGVGSVEQLQEILGCWNQGDANLAPEFLASTDLSLIDPRKWTPNTTMEE